MKKFKTLLPLFAFLVIIFLLGRGLGMHPNQVPSPLVDKKAPNFSLPNLLNPMKRATERDFLGHVTLFNVWATWCSACADEHEMLVEIAKNKNIVVYGLLYKDKPDEARIWLKRNENPYQTIAVDQTGEAAIDWGVYGTPETFVIDKKGMIRYKQIGAITAEIWEQTMLPLIRKLQDEPL